MKNLAALILLLPTLSLGLPQESGEEGDFLSWGAGARGLGMGKAYVALAKDASATYWNPAGLAFADHAEGSVLHALLWEGASYDFIGGALPTLTEGSFGFNATMLSIGGVELRDLSNNALGGSIGLIKQAVTISYGFSPWPNVGLGISFKQIGRWFDGDHTGFLTGDAGVQWQPIPELLLGGILQHPVALKYGNTDDALPLRSRFGAAYLLPWVGTIGFELEQSGRWHLGFETASIGPLTVRTGLDIFEWSAGVGVEYASFHLDYAAAQHLDLGLSHRLSLTFALGESVGSQRLDLAKAAYERALDATAQGNVEQARAELEQVMKFDRLNTLAPNLLERLGREADSLPRP